MDHARLLAGEALRTPARARRRRRRRGGLKRVSRAACIGAHVGSVSAIHSTLAAGAAVHSARARSSKLWAGRCRASSDARLRNAVALVAPHDGVSLAIAAVCRTWWRGAALCTILPWPPMTACGSCRPPVDRQHVWRHRGRPYIRRLACAHKERCVVRGLVAFAGVELALDHAKGGGSSWEGRRSRWLPRWTGADNRTLRVDRVR